VSQKTPTQSFSDKTTSFNNPITVAFYNELRKKLLYNPPPHLKCVAALPCEIWLTIVIKFKSARNRLFTVNIYRHVIYSASLCLYQLIYCITACVQKSAISRQACFASWTPLCRRIVAVLCQAYSRHCRNLLCWQMTSSALRKDS